MTAQEIVRKIDSLNLWDVAKQVNWAIKPCGTAIPYFCNICGGQGPKQMHSIMLFEGWRTFQDFLCFLRDHDYGFYSSVEEFSHYAALIGDNGEISVFRVDPGRAPCDLTESQAELFTKMLWEVYGVMMRIESDEHLTMKYADERAIFARVENKDGTWCDAPLSIPDICPHTEHFSIPVEELKQVKDMPFVADRTVEFDCRLTTLVEKANASRRVYMTIGVDSANPSRAMLLADTIDPDTGLRGIWETLPCRFMTMLRECKCVPGNIRVCSKRVFRLLRPLCSELPFRLSLNSALAGLDAHADRICNRRGWS